jgi:predicted dehydrogenase
MTPKINRRTFTKGAAALGAAAALQAGGLSATAAKNRVRLGFIGVGNRGDQLLDAFLVHKDAEVVALCDVYKPYLAAAQKKVGGKAKLYDNFRKLLEHNGLDAVVIATPDHWHALQFIEACRRGKHVYVEKPLSLTIAEGRKMVEVARETKRITQVGLHRRSSPVIKEAVALLRKGEIGKITVAKCFHLRDEFPMGIGSPADCDPPEGLNWDMWLGPAPKVRYNPNRCLYKFRWFWDYSGGQLTNFGTHYLDVIQWALGKDAPKGVFALGGKFAVRDNREIPDTLEVVWEYEGGTLVTMSQYNANRSPGNRLGWELEFRGTKGTLLMQEGQGYQVIPEKVRTRELPALSPLRRKENQEQNRAVREEIRARARKGRADTADHARSFLDAVLNGKPASCPVEVGHRSTSATLLAKISFRLGRYLKWDAKNERVLNDEEANKMLTYAYRAPWRLA